MTKIRFLIYGISVVLLFGGLVYFLARFWISSLHHLLRGLPQKLLARKVAFPTSMVSHPKPHHGSRPTREQPASQARRQKLQSSPTSQRDGQGPQEEQADTVSLPSPERRPATTDLTELEQLQVEQQRLLEEQMEQEAAAYEESLRSTKRPLAFADLTELEQLQVEQQR